MRLWHSAHASDEHLEQYAMRLLPETTAMAFEDHLVLCSSCQERLEELDEYLDSMRRVLTKLRQQPQSWWRDTWCHLTSFFTAPRPVWASAFGLAALALVLSRPWQHGAPPNLTPLPVRLEASRGPNAASAHIPSGRLLVLTLDATGLPPATAYRLEVVDSRGKKLWESVAKLRAGEIQAALSQALKPGHYYARVYAGSELLREFALGLE